MDQDNVFALCLRYSCSFICHTGPRGEVTAVTLVPEGDRILELKGRPVRSPQAMKFYAANRRGQFPALADDVLEVLQNGRLNERFIELYFGRGDRLSQLLLADPRVRQALVGLARNPERGSLQRAAVAAMGWQLPERGATVPVPDSPADPLARLGTPPLHDEAALRGFSVPAETPSLNSPAAFVLDGGSIQPAIGGITSEIPEVVIATISGIRGERYFPLRRFSSIGSHTIEGVVRGPLHFGPLPGSEELASLAVRLHFAPDSIRYETVHREGRGYYRIPLLLPEYGYVDRTSFRVVGPARDGGEGLTYLTASPDVRVVSEGGVGFVLVATDADPEEVRGLEYAIIEMSQPVAPASFHGVTLENRRLDLTIDYEAAPDLARYVRWVKGLRVPIATKVDLLRRWVAANIRYSFTEAVSDLYDRFHGEFELRFAAINDPRERLRYNLVNFALQQRVGICGIQEVVFSALVRDVLRLPTRRVEGMLTGGEVTQDHFHAWTEVFLPEGGGGRWYRFDATSP